MEVTPLRAPPTHAPEPEPASDETSDLFDYALVRHVIGFIFRGVGRHRALAGAVFALTMALVVGWMVVAPRTWHVEARLLASHSQIIRSLGNPRSSGTPFEDPTRAAEETVYARDNLLSLIKQTQLIEKVAASRTFVGRARDGALALVFGAPTPSETVDALADVLEKKLKVVTDSQTVVISLDWPEADTAFQVVETAQQNFLEARHVSEMTAIAEALSILQAHAATEQTAVTEALQELQRVREVRREGGSSLRPPVALETTTEASASPAAATRSSPAFAAAPANEAELAQLKFLLHARRRALADLEEFRSRRLLELNAQLVEQRVQYADKHPTIVDTTQRIAAMNQPSPQMTQVRDEVAALLEEYRRKGGVAPDALVEPVAARPVRGPRTAPAAVGPVRLGNLELADDPEVEFAHNALRVASANLEELNLRIDSARIEQDSARAAFKYRYSVVRPASLPRHPATPNLQALFLGGLGLALLLALLSGAALEWRRGVLVEPWQVERALELGVLANVRRP
jgi:hypothetical protein